MKLYMAPGSCSTGIHILMEEVDLIFEAYIINLPAGDNLAPDFLALNPKGTIPVLVTDEQLVLTDYTAISFWLADRFPDYNLLPASINDRAKALEITSYIVNTIHGQGFTRIFVPEQYFDEQSSIDAIHKRGIDIVSNGLHLVAEQLRDNSYLLGDFTVADTALFYTEFWAFHQGLALPPQCDTHFRTMLGRASVRQVLTEEGYANVLRNVM